MSTVTVFDRAALAFAEELQHRTAPEALIVRATTVNHPVLLAGRRSLLGYPSRVWSHGIDTTEREAQIACIYSGCADAVRILAMYGVDYLVVGPPERETLQVNDAFVRQFPVDWEAGGYRLAQRASGEDEVRSAVLRGMPLRTDTMFR